MERLTRLILIIAGLLSVIACLLVIESTARKTGFKQGVQYCQLMPEICHGAEFVGDRFGA